MQMMMFEKILLSLAIGALIGTEREWRVEEGREVFAGVRTFMLVCLMGVLVPYISTLTYSMLPVFIGLAAIVGAILLGYYANFKKHSAIGLTTEMAFILTYLIGMILFFESSPYFISISLGIILTLILFSRESLHGFARGLDREEIRDAVIFAVLVFIVLPLLPEQPVGPYDALDLMMIWRSMVIVMGVSFAGYVSMKIFGEKRGLGLTGFFGGLASSTSVTISMAERAKKNSNLTNSASFATIIASSTMFFRLLLVVFFFDKPIAISLLPSMIVLGIIGYVVSYESWKKIKRRAKIDFGSPISFKPVFQFVVILTSVLFLSRVAEIYLPSALYLLAIVSGIFDVDAITLSLISLSSGTPAGVITNGIILAAFSNTFSKMMLARWIGGKKAGKDIMKSFIPLIVAGLIVLAFHFLI